MRQNILDFCVALNQASLDQIRKIVRDEVDKALLAREYPSTVTHQQGDDEDKRREELWYEE